MIFQALEFFERKKRQEVNALSHIHAVGWASLMGGFGGNKINPADLLPFKQDAEEANRSIQRRTIGILVDLIERGKLPPRVVAAAQIDSDVKRALGLEG